MFEIFGKDGLQEMMKIPVLFENLEYGTNIYLKT